MKKVKKSLNSKKSVNEKSYYRLLKTAIYYQKLTQECVSGRAFTNYECVMCNGLFKHPSTNVPLFCDKCFKLANSKVKEMSEAGELDVIPFDTIKFGDPK